MPEVDFNDALEAVVTADGRFPRDAYHFVREALDHTHELLKQRGIQLPRPEQGRHISGAELLDGIRAYALEQFGPMTLMVLGEWGIKSCEDFGDIVFNMVEHRILSKTEKDSRDDFKGGYDFEDAFRKPFLPSVPRNGCITDSSR